MEAQKLEVVDRFEKQIGHCWNKAVLVPENKGDCCCEGKNSSDCECDRIKITFVPKFEIIKNYLDKDEECGLVVVKRKRPPRITSGFWYFNQGRTTTCHEFGHHIGLPDEYADERQPNRPVISDGGLMGTGRKLKDRYFKRQEDFANRKLSTCGCKYKVKL